MTHKPKTYFKPVFLEEETEEEIVEERFPSADELQGLFRTINAEFEDYQAGRSKFSKQAVVFDQRTGPPPLFNMFTIFKQNPNTRTWEMFLQLVEQDTNSRVKDYFIEQFELVKEQQNDPKTDLGR